jgi:hypothetical protein
MEPRPEGFAFVAEVAVEFAAAFAAVAEAEALGPRRLEWKL